MAEDSDPVLPKELLSVLGDEDQIARLTHYARYRIKTRYWRISRNGVIRGGVEAKDVVFQAIAEALQAYTGKSSRSAWTPESGRDPMNYLKGVVDNVLARCGINPNYRDTNSESELISDGEDENNSVFLTLPAKANDNSESEELEAQGAEFIAGFRDYLAEEPELLDVVDCYLNGTDKPAQIAEKLKITVSEVNNRQRRLRNRAKAYRQHPANNARPPERPARHSQSSDKPTIFPRLITNVRSQRRSGR